MTIDPNGTVLRLSPTMRVAVAIRRGEQFVEIGEFGEALKEYQKALEVNRQQLAGALSRGRGFLPAEQLSVGGQRISRSAERRFEPKWTEVWAHIKLGKIFDVSGQRDRAVNEYNQAIRTRDNTCNAQEEAAKYLKQPFERKHSNI